MSATRVSTSTLAGVPLFAGADADALEALSADAHPVRALAGEWVIRAGDEAEDLFVVLRGRLRVVADADGEERTLRVLGPGRRSPRSWRHSRARPCSAASNGPSATATSRCS